MRIHRFLFLLSGLVLLTACTTSAKPQPTLLPSPVPTFTPTPMVAEVAGQACLGKGIPEAADFAEDPNAIHKIAIAGMDGTEHHWDQSIEEVLQAKDLTDLEVVICVSNPIWDEKFPLSCGEYKDEKGETISLQSGRAQLNARLVTAKTGQVLDEIELFSTYPSCPEKISTGDSSLKGTILYSDFVSYETVIDWALPVVVPQSIPIDLQGTGIDHRNYAIKLSRDGKWIAGNSPDDPKVIQLWDVSTSSGRVLSGHTSDALPIAFSPDGSLLVSGSSTGEVFLWDVVNGQIRHKLESHKESVYTALFSADGKKLVTGGNGMSIVLWDVESGRVLDNLVGFQYGTINFAFSSDGSLLAASGREDEAVGQRLQGFTVWDLETGEEKMFALQKVWNLYGFLEFSADKQQLVAINVVSGDYSLMTFDIASEQLAGEIVTTTFGQPAEVANVGYFDYLPERDWFIGCRNSCVSLLIYDMTKNELLREVQVPESIKLTTHTMTEDGRYMVTSSPSDKLALWYLGWMSEFK